MPSWQHGAEAAHELDINALTRAANAIVDLVFTEDTVFMDALPKLVQIELIPTMSVLIGVLEDEHPDPGALAAAARMTRKCVLAYRRDCPQELIDLAMRLPGGPCYSRGRQHRTP